MKVLIADDDPVARAIVERIVRARGYEPVLAEGGRAALAAIMKEEVPLLVTDWNMPEIDGLELCRRVRAPQRKAYTYVILLTTQSGRKKLLEALEAGIDDFLTKPVDADELAARLKSGERVIEMQKHLRQMQGLLSICMHCKKIREGKEWVPVDRYVAEHTATSFSHGFCPECLKKQIEG